MIQKLAEVVKVLFQRVSIERLLSTRKEEKIYYDSINESYLKDLLLTYGGKFSDTEIGLQITEVQSQVKNRKGEVLYSRTSNKVNVFSALFYYIPEVLTFYENRCVCRYNHMLEWNDLARIVGQDLPIAAMMASVDEEYYQERKNFSWPPIIGHNNGQLNRILQKGMADNHFHLRCAAPYFEISWINLMNNPGRADFIVPFEKMEKNYRDKRKKSEVGIARQPMRNLVLDAALIRLYLCSRLENFEIGVIPKEKESLESKKKLKREENFERETIGKDIKYLLEDCFRMENALSAIQAEIDCLQITGDFSDYLLFYATKICFEEEKEYQILVGERWFLYRMLKLIRIGDESFSRDEYNLFFAYLRIKNELRSELVQVNDIVGFENFQIYQRRKDYFSHTVNWHKSEGKLARLAVKDVLNNPAVRHLEVRISPEASSTQNAYTIKSYDESIVGADNFDDKLDEDIRKIYIEFARGREMSPFGDDDLRQRFHYVFQFTKTKDSIENRVEHMECRHYSYRKKIKSRAAQILKFREDYPQYGRRVVGIDACAQEIGCRPEVFARVFRTLKNHTIPLSSVENNYELPQLKITYHVGEDFLDVTDGLRAIDEAIRFLNLDCGDRLGHAMALGIDARSWYRAKNQKISLTLQDYLDNIVWLHHALIKYNIKDMSSLKGWLEEKYSQYFAYIYQPYIREMKNEDKADKALRYQGNFDLNTYYLAWLLRGDKPSLYKSGSFKQPEDDMGHWNRYAINKKNIRNDDIRNIREVCLMYHMYHYDEEVRKKGNETKTFTMPDFYIEGVIAVQKAMREEIVKRGIAIETNPSSNLLLSIMDSYCEHPIKVFYNHGLTHNEKELMECPQLNVSINTDDSGVFSTRLENEYALLACALEQEVQEDGHPKYRKEFIYDWLNNIREMGLRQVFISDKRGRW